MKHLTSELKDIRTKFFWKTWRSISHNASHFLYLSMPTYIHRYIIYIYILYIRIWGYATFLLQTFYISSSIIFRTNPVLSYDDGNYNNFAETQGCSKISFSFQHCFVCIKYLYAEDKMQAPTGNWALCKFCELTWPFPHTLGESSRPKTLVAGLQLSAIFCVPPQPVLARGHYNLTSFTSLYFELLFTS